MLSYVFRSICTSLTCLFVDSCLSDCWGPHPGRGLQDQRGLHLSHANHSVHVSRQEGYLSRRCQSQQHLLEHRHCCYVCCEKHYARQHFCRHHHHVCGRMYSPRQVCFSFDLIPANLFFLRPSAWSSRTQMPWRILRVSQRPSSRTHSIWPGCKCK